MDTKREITGDLHDMWMTYLPCPSLCRSCKRFRQEKGSNWPFHCHGGSTRSASSKAKDERDSGVTFDDCECYVEKTQEQNKPSSKGKSGSPIYTIIGFVILIGIGIKDYIETTGVIGTVISLAVIGFTVFRIVRQYKFIFNIFNCLWILLCVYIFFETTKGESDSFSLIISIVIVGIFAFIPSLIYLIVSKVRNKFHKKLHYKG